MNGLNKMLVRAALSAIVLVSGVCHAAESKTELEARQATLAAEIGQLRSTVALTRAEIADHNKKLDALMKEKTGLQASGKKPARLAAIPAEIQAINAKITQKNAVIETSNAMRKSKEDKLKGVRDQLKALG